MSSETTIRRFSSLSGIDAAQWDRMAGDANPFLRHDFLSGLEEFDCLEGHGWTPCHIGMFRGQRLAAAAALYLRSDSTGEFVFDWSWAEAFERAGGRYYPKLVSAIPFTPVCGARLLVDPEFAADSSLRRELARHIIDFADANRLSSFHCLFPDPEDAELLSGIGLLPRLTWQYHWLNRGYRDFQDFLDTLNAKRRKQIRRERKAVADAGVEIVRLKGGEISTTQWKFFHECYCSTFQKRWGSPRFTLEFFQALGHRQPDATLLILARRGSRYVAGAFAMSGGDGLYGRHWGCVEEVAFLHFELCYYQTIEYAIRHNLRFVDAGVQGEHKLARGFQTVAVSSCHWIRNAAFRTAVAEFVEREAAQVRAHIEMLEEHSAYRQGEC